MAKLGIVEAKVIIDKLTEEDNAVLQQYAMWHPELSEAELCLVCTCSPCCAGASPLQPEIVKNK